LGGVSGRSSSYLGQEQSCRQRAERGGLRHPGLQEAGSLRGAPADREPRSVHVVCGSFLSRGRAHRRQRMSGGRRGGECRRHATFQGACTGRKGNCKNATCAPADASFTRSSDPCALIVTTHRRQNRSVVTYSRRHRSRANPRKREEPAAGSARVNAARLAARHRFRKGEGVDA
jgi:hypothetical protein